MGVPMLFGGVDSGRGARPQISVLWENPDPSSRFTAQTVSLAGDLRHYDLVLVEYVYSTSLQNVWSKMFRASAVLNGTCVLPINDTNTSTGRRAFSAPDVASLAFTAATFGGSTANSQIIPVYVYGIKL